MRILSVAHDLGPGGTQRAAQNYALGYAEAGHDSACLGYAGGGPRADVLQEQGVIVFIGAPEDAAAATRRAIAWGPDLVHIHREGPPHPPSAAVLRAIREALPEVSVIETNVFSRADPSPDGALIDVHLHLSSWCLWKWEQWTRGTHPKPIGVVLPYATDPTSFYPDPGAAVRFREAHEIPEDAVLFGRVGQPDPVKWSPVLFDAFRDVAGRAEDAYLVVIGLPEALRTGALEALPAGVRQRVRDIPFLQGDAALRGAYSAMDVFAHAAHKGESFGMVLVEAMLCETPVVTLSRPARDNSQVEVVGPGEGGLVTANAAAFADAMRDLHADPAARVAWGRAAAARTRRRYALDVVMPDLLRLVEVVRSTAGREGLPSALQEAGFSTHTSDEEIQALSGAVRGRPPLMDRVLSRLVHHPAVYRAWSRLRT